MTNGLVSVVVVAYNSADDLRKLLPGLDHPQVQVIVVDNSSTDESRTVAAAARHVTLVALSSNTGWTAANNLGAAAATGEYVVFLNPDAGASAVQLLALAARLTQQDASVSPRFVEADGTTSAFYFRRPGPWSGLFTFTSVGRRVDNALGGRAMQRRLYHSTPRTSTTIDQPGGACLVMRRETFLEVDFDASMWLFFSDAAWCDDQVRAGRRHQIAWDIEVRHVGGSSVNRLPSASLQRLFQRDYFAYSLRSYGTAGKLITTVGLCLLGVFAPCTAALLRRDLTTAALRWGLIADMVKALQRRPPGPI